MTVLIKIQNESCLLVHFISNCNSIRILLISKYAYMYVKIYVCNVFFKDYVTLCAFLQDFYSTLKMSGMRRENAFGVKSANTNYIKYKINK